MKNWLYIAIGVVIALIIILWPKSETCYPAGVPESYCAELDKVLAESGREEALRDFLAQLPENQQ